MRLPPKGTRRQKVLALLHKHGQMSISAICELMLTEERRQIGETLKALVASDLVKRADYTYDLMKPVRDYMDGCEPVKDDFVPQIATPRIWNAWTPEMKGYEAMLRRNWRAQ